MKKIATAIVITLWLTIASFPSGHHSSTDSSTHKSTHHSSTSTNHHHNYYTNSSGHRVHTPVQARSAPAGATAKCGDGTYSFSEHRSGTCSHHGGVSSWLVH